MNLTEKEKEQFVAVANSVLKETGDEGRAIASGLSVIRKRGKEFDEIEEIKRTSEVQSVAFKKSKFDKTQAVSWLKSHDLKSGDFRETEEEMRFRQTDPNKYDSFARKEIADGISFILGIINKSNNTMQTKQIDFEIKSFDEEKGTFEGYGSIFDNVDSYDDIVERGAFTESIKKVCEGRRKIKMLWQHNTKEPIGVYDEVREDEKGLYVKGRLVLEVQKAKEAYALMKAGAISGLSIGYSIPKGGSEIDKNIRHIKNVELYEISLVTMPANELAQVENIKKNIEQFECMKDFENFLKDPHSLGSQERKIFISRLKEFSNKRDAEEENADKRDVEAINKLKCSLALGEIYLSTKK